MSARTPVLSLGAGVQSSVLLLMAASGELEERTGWPAPELAVFADTGWEAPGTYEWLALLRMEAWRGGIEVATVRHGNLRDDLVAAASGELPRASNPPLYVRNEDGSRGMIQRGCSRDYKVRPIRAELRRRGFGPRRPVTQYIGFTLDEWERQRGSDVRWATTAHPLIDARMTHHDCVLWLERRGWPVPPKSACVGCPMRRNDGWRDMKLNRPEEWADAVEFDRAVRVGLPRLERPAFLHDSLVPLDEADVSNAEDRGQLALCDAAGCFT